MSAIRVPRTRRENTVQQRGATLPGGDLDPGPGPHLDQNVLAGYAAVALALILDPSCGLFSDAARPCQRPAPPSCAKTRTATTSPSAGLRPLGMSQTQTLSC